MKKRDFYLCLNLLNIIFSIYIIEMVLILWELVCTVENGIIVIGLYALFITIKILFLPILFHFVKNKHLNELAEELKNNPNSRKLAQLLYLSYDMVILLFILFLLFKQASFLCLLFCVIFCEILSFVGIYMFYVPLFEMWKKQNKLNIKDNK